MFHSASDLLAQARAALQAANRDPVLDGLIGWYAMEARHLGAGHTAPFDLGQLVYALTDASPHARLYESHTAGTLAAAGVLRAMATAQPKAA